MVIKDAMFNPDGLISELTFDSYLEARTVLSKLFEEDIKDSLVFCEADMKWALSEDTYKCDNCDSHFLYRGSLSEYHLCDSCQEDYDDEEKHKRELQSDYYASR